MELAVEHGLTAAAAKVLLLVRQGGHIEARRAFPVPHRYQLFNASGRKEGDPLAAGLVADLVMKRLITGKPLDATYDRIDYSAALPAPRPAQT